MILYKDDHEYLLTKCMEVPDIYVARELGDDMLGIMAREGGVGLAANQIGILWRVIVMDVSARGEQRHVLINPEIIAMSEKLILKPEGCLSYPDHYIDKARPKWVKVKYVNHAGEIRIKRFRDTEARIICHEMDHLNGVRFLDE